MNTGTPIFEKPSAITLQGHRLAGAGGPGDQAMAVGEAREQVQVMVRFGDEQWSGHGGVPFFAMRKFLQFYRVIRDLWPDIPAEAGGTILTYTKCPAGSFFSLVRSPQPLPVTAVHAGAILFMRQGEEFQPSLTLIKTP